MPQSDFDAQRLKDLDRLIRLDYEKLRDFEEGLTIASGQSEKFNIKQLIQREVVPSLRRHEGEYAALLAAGTTVEMIPEREAASLVNQTMEAANSLELAQKASPNQELMRLIAE